MINYSFLRYECQNLKLKDILRLIRTSSGFTQKEFGELLEINRSLVQKYEYGIIKPLPKHLEEIVTNFCQPKDSVKIINLLTLRYYLDTEPRAAEPTTKTVPHDS